MIKFDNIQEEWTDVGNGIKVFNNSDILEMKNRISALETIVKTQNVAIQELFQTINNIKETIPFNNGEEIY